MAPAQGHDFWIQPASFAPKKGATLDLRLFIGHDEERTEFRRSLAHLVLFACVEPDGATKEVPGEHGQIAGTYPLTKPGLHLFAYRSAWQPVSMTPEKFTAYLKKEDLREALAAHRKQMAAYEAPDATAKRPAKISEMFSRNAKSLVAVDGNPEGRHDRVLGLPFEIVAVDHPLTTAPTHPIRFRVLLDGKPHANARLAAYREKTPDKVLETRTDAQGVAALTLQTPGMWVVRCIRITRSRRARVDWQSMWATLTFERSARRN